MSEMRRLSIVIPSYNARALLRRTLRTLAVAAPEAEVIVVDGASHDGSPEMVRAEFPSAILLELQNHGFGHATNRGLEVANGDFLLLCNSDLFVSKSALETMKARLASDKLLAAVGPVLLNEDGTKQSVFGPFYYPNWMPIRTPTRVPLISGACLMTRRDVLSAIGALDENFFLYNEEWDWCARALRAGYHLELVPEEVVHVGGGSTSRSPELRLEAQRGFLYLAQKHAPEIVVQGLRRAMQFEGWSYKRMDPRPRHRAMWAQLESLSAREAYLESPFPLSGRGDQPARPMFWRELAADADRLPITGRHSIPRIVASEAARVEESSAPIEAPVSDGVRRKIGPASPGAPVVERPRVVPLRAPKLARAGS
jgi:GT2 family glycosyltransferase